MYVNEHDLNVFLGDIVKQMRRLRDEIEGLRSSRDAANHKIKRLQQQVRGLGYAPLFEE